MIRRLLVVLACAALSAGSSAGDEDVEILAAGAISLRDALSEAAERFEAKNAGTVVQLHTAGSGALARQIESGAPVEVFFSASPVEIDRLDRLGMLQPGTRTTFASNGIVVIVPPGSIPPAEFAAIAGTEFSRVALGNPKTVPAGRYAKQALISTGLWETVEPRTVYAENVRQVVEYVARGDVDLGLVYTTDLLRFRERVVAGPAAPSGSHDPVRYEAALVSDGTHREVARRFLRFVVSEEGRAILAIHGFLPPPDE